MRASNPEIEFLVTVRTIADLLEKHPQATDGPYHLRAAANRFEAAMRAEENAPGRPVTVENT